jgi:hypothetical protein
MASPQDEQLKVYEQLCNSYRAIDDFRAKLLGFLPLATGTGVFLLLTDQAKLLSMQNLFRPIGFFGIVITLGLFFYELYGIKKCTRLIERGKHLEEKVLKVSDGQFATRPPGVALLINEPFAASLIYPAVLAAWTFVAFAFPTLQDPLPSQSQGIGPLKFQAVAQYWAIAVFLASFALAFSYNVYLVKNDIKEAFDRVRTRKSPKTATSYPSND